MTKTTKKIWEKAQKQHNLLCVKCHSTPSAVELFDNNRLVGYMNKEDGYFLSAKYM